MPNYEAVRIHRQGHMDTRSGQRAQGAVDDARALVAPGSTNEQGNVVTTGLTLYMPLRSPRLDSTDRVEVRGRLYSVVGDPAEWRSAYGSLRGGIVVYLQHVTA